MKMIDILLIIIIAAILFSAVKLLNYRKRSGGCCSEGCSGCSGNCSGCGKCSKNGIRPEA